MANILIFNPIWTPDRELATVFLVKAPYIIDQKMVVEDFIPIRYEALVKKYQRNGGNVSFLKEYLHGGYFNDRLKPSAVAEEIMSTEEFDRAKAELWAYGHFYRKKQWEITPAEAAIIYKETTLVSLMESLLTIASRM